MSLKFPISLVGNRVAGTPTPLHWWDLDDLTVGLTDQGDGTNDMSLTNVGSNVDTSDAPDGGDSILIAASNQYLHTLNNFAWDGSGNEASWAAWFKCESQSSLINSILTWRGANSTTPRIIQIDVQNSTADIARTIIFDDDSSDDLIVTKGTSEVSPATPSWFHVVGVFDGVDTVEIFVNGTSEGAATNTSFGIIEQSTSPFAIGAASWDKQAASVHHDGNVWACGIWDEALQQDDIDALYNSGSGAKYADLW